MSNPLDVVVLFLILIEAVLLLSWLTLMLGMLNLPNWYDVKQFFMNIKNKYWKPYDIDLSNFK